MTKKEKEIIEEILHTAMNNPGGYYEEWEFDEEDESPVDICILNASIIIRRCRKLLGIVVKEEEDKSITPP
jgi:hypothetical protein